MTRKQKKAQDKRFKELFNKAWAQLEKNMAGHLCKG